MPYVDPEDQRRYHKEWYRRNRKAVIERVAQRKRTEYAGTCIVCGGPTVGYSKNKAPEYCGKPSCRRMQALRYVEQQGEERAQEDTAE